MRALFGWAFAVVSPVLAGGLGNDLWLLACPGDQVGAASIGGVLAGATAMAVALRAMKKPAPG